MVLTYFVTFRDGDTTTGNPLFAATVDGLGEEIVALVEDITINYKNNYSTEAAILADDRITTADTTLVKSFNRRIGDSSHVSLDTPLVTINGIWTSADGETKTISGTTKQIASPRKLVMFASKGSYCWVKDTRDLLCNLSTIQTAQSPAEFYNAQDYTAAHSTKGIPIIIESLIFKTSSKNNEVKWTITGKIIKVDSGEL